MKLIPWYHTGGEITREGGFQVAERPIYVVLLREKGLFLVEPTEGFSQREAVEAALGLGGGYSAGLVYVDVPEDAVEAWAAWVEGTAPTGRPYFMLRAFEASLTEAEVEERLRAAGEEAHKLVRGPIYRPTERRQEEPPPVEFRPGV